jgi:hypothetical protein
LSGLKRSKTSLNQKTEIIKNGQNTPEEQTVEAEHDNELERLRLEALSAKKSKNNNSNNKYNKSKNAIRLPGRFRYERDSHDDDDDDDDDLLQNSTHHTESEEENDSEKKKSSENPAPSSIKIARIHSKYETYKNECKKLMSLNESYEPEEESNREHTDLKSKADLRYLLRSKALLTQSSNEPYDPLNYSLDNLINDQQSINQEDLSSSYQPVVQSQNQREIFYNRNFFNKNFAYRTIIPPNQTQNLVVSKNIYINKNFKRDISIKVVNNSELYLNGAKNADLSEIKDDKKIQHVDVSNSNNQVLSKGVYFL